jgi:hypothetical protein
MTIKITTQRAATGILAIALAASTLVGAGSANAADIAARTAAVSVDTGYLQSVSPNLPADNVIETVTYDRFQWLLGQSGQFAFVIGSAADAGFAANLVKVNAAAKAAGAVKVYWFDPNLSGQSGIKSLDIRNTGSINLAAGSQGIFGNIWKNVLGQYLGNGIKSVAAATRTSVTVSNDDTVVNDSVNPIWDYRSTATAAVSSKATVFFTYDKSRVSGAAADKVASWVDLSTSTTVDASLTAAFTAIGGSTIDQLSQFDWWKDSANTKHDLAYADDTKFGGDILTNADDDNGWVVKQITYPELLRILDDSSANKNYVILFGGTWCHNTRAVLKQVNQNALENGVTTVYNFDLVLDGGTVNGTNGGANPIHVRSAANGGTPSVFNFRPSWAYGDVVRKYFKNLVTEYDPNTGAHVSFYPGGDLNAFPDVVRRLQVPFVINYQRGTGASPDSASIKRQWIQRNVDSSTGLATYREYMSEQWFTTPSAQLGLSFALPADAKAEAALTDAEKALLATAKANATFGAQAVSALNEFFDGLPGAVVATRTVKFTAKGSAQLTLGGLYGRTPDGVATLTIGSSKYTAKVTGGIATFKTKALTAGTAYTLTYATDSQIVGFTDKGKIAFK